jgi:hypothetical protein
MALEMAIHRDGSLEMCSQCFDQLILEVRGVLGWISVVPVNELALEDHGVRILGVVETHFGDPVISKLLAMYGAMKARASVAFAGHCGMLGLNSI